MGENGAVPVAPTTPTESTLLAAGAPCSTALSDTVIPSASRDGGQAASQASSPQRVQAAPPIPALAASTAKKHKMDQRFAELQASNRDTAIANAAAAKAKAAEKATGADSDDE